MIDREALKESLSDTVIATIINFPLNYLLITLALWLELGAFAMTCFIMSILFCFAVVRKYYVRTWFDKRTQTND